MTTQAFEDVPMPGLELEVPERSGAQICAPERVATGSAMTLEQAQSVTESIRRSLTVAHDLLVLAWQQRAWVPLGYAGWDAYVAGEFADLALRPPREDQPQTLASMRAAGMSTRAISAATDLSEGTVRNRLREAAAAGLEIIEGSVGLDGKTYTPGATEDRTDRNELVHRLRGEGLTVREISQATSVSTGTVQAALARSAQPSTHADELGLGQLHVHDRQAPNLAAMFHDDAAEPQVDVALLSALARAGELLREHFHPSPDAVGDEVVRAVSTMTAACCLAVSEISEVAPHALSVDVLDSSAQLLDTARGRVLEGGQG